MNQYNPEQPLLDLLPEVKAAVEEAAAAELEYEAIQAEIRLKFGDRLNAAQQRRAMAKATAEVIKDQFKEHAYQVWQTTYAADGQRKFFTVDHLVTIQAKDRIAEYDRVYARQWVFENIPALLEVRWDVLEALTLARIKGLLSPLVIEQANVVAVNLDKVAALTEVQPDALVREKTDGVSTPLMVRRDDTPPMSDSSVPAPGWED